MSIASINGNLLLMNNKSGFFMKKREVKAEQKQAAGGYEFKFSNNQKQDLTPLIRSNIIKQSACNA
jgi:hypothetical protein